MPTEAEILARADEMRRSGDASPYALWKLADDAARGMSMRRQELYVHAGLHAGMFVERETGKPWAVCPKCEAVLDA